MSGQQQLPSPLIFDNQIFDLAFHPSQNIIATGSITGQVFCHRYDIEFNQNILSVRPHRKSCRGLEFSHDGSALFSVSKDRSIQVIDLETSAILVNKSKAHEKPINCVSLLNENILATGDDEGYIKIWDTRTGNELMEYSDHQDFISNFAFRTDTKTLITTSGDGTLAVYDIRRPNLVAISDNQDDELLSVAIIKNDRKVVVGTQNGVINLFSWNEWSDCNDRFIGHPSSIDTIVKINEDLICTGSSDGIISEDLANMSTSVISTLNQSGETSTITAPSNNNNRTAEWDVKMEIEFFRSVMKHRPVGIHRHFHMVNVYRDFNANSKVKCTIPELWERFGSYFNLAKLEELDREFDEEADEDSAYVEFSLPMDEYEYYNLIEQNRGGRTKEPSRSPSNSSLESSPELEDNTPNKKRRTRTTTRKSDVVEFNSATTSTTTTKRGGRSRKASDAVATSSGTSKRGGRKKKQ
ncbi:6841_t:CDS:10 [Diversispora eburnea]|uniref:WD repeat-containing protein JIP5 n=1 Tax=Diversispora eburnea TaxID=1213867 RepID=A0A9N9BM84_9GLOM|nr:6841_t:CDS:10 [Diversispora eburnea]